MMTKLLINPNSQQVAARLEENRGSKQLIISDLRIQLILENCGINVPRKFTPDSSCHVYPNHPDQSLFAEAFEKHFYPHGLMQRGFYWIKEEEYKMELKNVTEVFSKHIISF